MRSRVVKWIVLCLLCVAGAWLFWRLEDRPAGNSAVTGRFSYTASRPVLPGQLPTGNQPVPARVKAALATNALALRLSNTPKSIGELENDPHAILLENALIDTRNPLDFSIPKHLKAQGEPGAYIVQSRGPLTAAIRAVLAQAGGQIVSYIPNDAYLVSITKSGAGALSASSLIQSVIPYEPYYKIQSSLLNAAVGQKPLPQGAVLNLGLSATDPAQTIAQIEKLGGTVLAQDRSPFGPVLRVQPPQNWTALAALPDVQIVEGFRPRVHANDLSRVNTGVSTDTITNTTYLGLSGSNVIVQVNDSGIDATHPDFTTGGSAASGAGGTPIRVLGFTTNDIVDTDGHGTFVAGEIAGNGAASKSPTAVGAVLAAHHFGSVTNADFRGKAPLAKLFAMNLGYSDQSLQEEAALTNALISNNSWNYDGDNSYSLASASYDAATRDALPEVTGSQPVLFVFAAGNSGNGEDSLNPGAGDSDSIQAPATAKNVISVGAIQESRSITNYVTNTDGTISQRWLPETSTSFRIAGFSSRGNVGIGIEGTYGRFKPDVVAPGTFTVSTRSAQWAITNYFYQNPTNYDIESFPGVIADPDSLWANGFPIVPNNAISVSILVDANADSPSPFPTNPIYVSMIGSAFPGSPPIATSIPNQVNIPSDGGFTIAGILSSEAYNGFNYGISNTTSSPLSFDLTTIIVTTNSLDNHLLVLSNLDNLIAPYYRFESGTSMSAADVSGVLALMQDFFTNTLHQTPSPAMLKAMLINGARPTSPYNLQVNNTINYDGWGLVNLPNSLPTNNPANYNGSVSSSIYIQDQSPTNALATGESHSLALTILTNTATLRVTLAWTDPPGNPAAAIKLVNSLELVVTNMANPTNPVVYYGNDIPAGGFFNTAESASNSLSPDVINNVQNVILPSPLGTNYTIAVIGREVNVNAVTAQTNIYVGPPNSSGVLAPNVVQDYALVISSGSPSAPGSFTITDNGIVSNPTADQNVTIVTTTNTPLLNQFVGANTPLLGTNMVGLGANTPWSSSGALTVGMTNQWHFYVAMNTGTAADFTNAGFVTLLPPTLSIPREGVFAGSQANATRPQADIDIYVTTDSTLTNLNPTALTNCLLGGQVGVSTAGVFNGASLGRAGTEFVVDTRSTPGQVYYVGVKSEAQTASEYAFVPIFSNIPFSQTNNNGDEIVNGQLLPFNIPDGTPADPGVNFSIGLAIFPITVEDITVTIGITHENFGDLYGTLTHSDNASGLDTVDVLNNHNAWGSVGSPGFPQFFIYNDNPTNVPSGAPPATVYRPSDGPGSLQLFTGQDGTGVWRMTEVDDSLTQTGSVQNFSMFIKRHRDLTTGITNTLAAGQWFYDFVDVPAGATNLIISATNLMASPLPLDVFVKFGAQPTTNNFDKMIVVPGTTPPPQPGGSISIAPTDVPPIQPGRYWIGVFNPNAVGSADQTFSLIATILPPNPSGTTQNFTSTGTTTLLDDAVTYSDILVTNTQPIVSVNAGIRVDHPRISDLVFHLIGPDGTRVLLMENRGGDTTNGAGATVILTNIVNASAGGNGAANTNSIDTGETSGSLPINFNFYTVPDEMTVYYGTNVDPTMLILDTGFTNNPGSVGKTLTVDFAPTNGVTSTFLTIVMNQFGNPAGAGGTAWIYTAGGVFTNYYYLTFTEDTNLTTTPIKYAVPPFVPFGQTNYVLQTNIVYTTNMFAVTNGFESAVAGDYASPSTVNAWTVNGNQVSVVTDTANAYAGSNYLALASGVISNTLPTVAGNTYTLTFAYRGPGIAAMWRAENNALDSINGNNGTLAGATTSYTTVWTNGFEGGVGTYGVYAGSYFAGGWYVEAPGGSYIDVLSNLLFSATDYAYSGGYCIDLNGGSPCGISTNIATVAGITYTLNFAYVNNPGVATAHMGVVVNGSTLAYVTANQANAWANLKWQTTSYVFTATSASTHLAFISTNTPGASGMLLDAVGLTTNVTSGTATYTTGEVGRAFKFDDINSYITVPASTSLDVGDGTSLTLECWVKPDAHNVNVFGGPIIEWDSATLSGLQMWTGNGALLLGFNDTSGNPHNLISSTGLIVNTNVFYHVAGTYNKISGLTVLYVSGTNVASGNLGSYTPQSTSPLNIGRRTGDPVSTGANYGGLVDELSVYNRDLSASEIKAIYQKGFAGKFDSASSFSANLAEAQITLDGGTPTSISGNNTNWQIETITFTAAQNGTSLKITGIEPGMLLDSFAMPGSLVVAVTNVITNAVVTTPNLYYLPEQSLGAFTGKSAYGDWLLEIQDDRAGAGLTNSLVSWQLQFVFANTNAVAAVLSGGIGLTNQFIPANSIAWYQISVPNDATIATNLLLFASAPLNVWFSTNAPPTITSTNDVDLIPNATIGVSILTTTSAPTNIVPGGTYYLGVQNTNNFTVNYGIKVNFNGSTNEFSSLTLSSISQSGSGTTLKWTASPTAQFEVLWTDDLTQPWKTDTNVITSSDGNFTFTDDGSQTAPLGGMRFYRLKQISP